MLEFYVWDLWRGLVCGLVVLWHKPWRRLRSLWFCGAGVCAANGCQDLRAFARQILGVICVRSYSSRDPNGTDICGAVRGELRKYTDPGGVILSAR